MTIIIMILVIIIIIVAHILYIIIQIMVSVDSMYEAARSFAGSFSQLVSRVLFVGGAPNPKELPGSQATQNFHGCLKEVDCCH